MQRQRVTGWVYICRLFRSLGQPDCISCVKDTAQVLAQEPPENAGISMSCRVRAKSLNCFCVRSLVCPVYSLTLEVMLPLKESGLLLLEVNSHDSLSTFSLRSGN